MNRQTLITAFILLLAVSCNPVEQSQPATSSAEPLASATPTASIEQTTLPTVTATSTPTELRATNCATEEVTRLGQSIAEDYPFVTTEEVLTWFCNGADFEDILVALATEDETHVPAEEMLVMRAEGLGWEEIWQLVGFAE